MSRLAQIYWTEAGAETPVVVNRSMAGFWTRMARRNVDFALRMRAFAKEARLKLAPWPEQAKAAKEGCGAWASARRHIGEARQNLQRAKQFGEVTA